MRETTCFASSLALSLVLWAPDLVAAQGTDFSTWTDAQKEEFLLNAAAGPLSPLEVGVTGSTRTTLDNGSVQHQAHVQTIDVSRPYAQLGTGGVELNFTDSYKYNIAGYRLDRLINLSMVPVSVERRLRNEDSALTWWVDDTMMTMTEYGDDGKTAPDLLRWTDQWMHARLWNELIYNVDANQGNFVITDDWTLWLIDFTRSFRIQEELNDEDRIDNIRIRREVWDGLNALDFETLREVMGDLLTDRQVNALLKRRDLIIANLQAQIEDRGESRVIRD